MRFVKEGVPAAAPARCTRWCGRRQLLHVHIFRCSNALKSAMKCLQTSHLQQLWLVVPDGVAALLVGARVRGAWLLPRLQPLLTAVPHLCTGATLVFVLMMLRNRVLEMRSLHAANHTCKEHSAKLQDANCWRSIERWCVAVVLSSSESTPPSGGVTTARQNGSDAQLQTHLCRGRPIRGWWTQCEWQAPALITRVRELDVPSAQCHKSTFSATVATRERGKPAPIQTVTSTIAMRGLYTHLLGDCGYEGDGEAQRLCAPHTAHPVDVVLRPVLKGHAV